MSLLAIAAAAVVLWAIVVVLAIKFLAKGSGSDAHIDIYHEERS
jgi:hypothetical protein